MGLVLGAVLVAETAGDLATGASLASALGWLLGNMVEPLVGAGLIRRAGNTHGSLTRLRELLEVPLPGRGRRTAGPAGDRRGDHGARLGRPSRGWPQYVAGDALGVLVVAPVLLAWEFPHPRRSWWSRPRCGPVAVGHHAGAVQRPRRRLTVDDGLTG